MGVIQSSLGPSELSEFRAVPLSHMARSGTWRFDAMRANSRPRVLWFSKGQGRITIAGVTRGFSPNNVFFLPKGTMHRFEVSPRLAGTLIDFPEAHAGPFLEEPVHLRLKDVRDIGELTTLIERFRTELEDDRPMRDVALSHHGSLLLIWLERMAATDVAAPVLEGSASRIATAYTALVERDFAEGKTVSDFARALGVTPTHLTRACKAASGASAHAILSDRVMAEAHLLLADTTMPVCHVAEKLGFSSSAYFTRAFQRRTGKTPTSFRRSA